MDNKYTAFIENYLTNYKTKSAIMLTGGWGTGKSFYIQNVLKPYLEGKQKALAKKIKEIIDTKSSFADWLNNQIVRDQLKFDIKVCLIKNGYPPQYSPEVFRKVMEQVENFEENN